MNQHIAKTIEVIQAKIDGLLSLIETLRALGRDGDATSLSPSPAPTRAPAAAHLPAPARNGHSKPKPHRGGGGTHSRVSMDGVRCPLVLALTQPFGRVDVQTVLNVTEKAASGVVTRWKARGWLRSIGYNKYERTAKFPGAKAMGAKPEPAAKPSANREQLEAALKDACKQRDHARSNGRDTMVEMFQKDIDRIEQELESLA